VRATPDDGHDAAPDWRTALTTKAPYVAVDTPPAVLPDGFAPVGIELVCRHGSRTIAKLRTAQRASDLLAGGHQRGALLPSGQQLADAFRRFVVATESVGAGQLSDQGRAELRGIATRMAHRPTSPLASATSAQLSDVEVLSASKQRTRESAEVFVAALVAGSDRRLPEIRDDNALLYFHKSDQPYREYLAHDGRLAAALAAALTQPRTRDAARLLLGAILAPDFIEELAHGQHSELAVDEIDAAASVHKVWQAVAAAAHPGDPSETTRLLPLSALNWFGYLDDLETFYEKGPAFAGDDITFAMAGALLDDMITSADARLRNSSAPIARLRFTHAEEILPLAALLQVPTADRPVTQAEAYTYESNPFRGAHLAPMAANIQWEIYSNGTTALVRMLINELPTRFAQALRPIDPSGDIYDFSEIERHYARTRHS
jgi:hypothetical protein